MTGDPWLAFDAAVSMGAFHGSWTGAFHSPRVVIAGPSGSGKSTFLRVVAGVESRVRGTLRCQSALWLDTSDRVRVPAPERHAAWVPQAPLLFPHLSVERNLAFAGAAPSDIASVAEALQLTPLLARYPRNLSGGEAQRASIARALLSTPRVLLLDEPFSALDKTLRASVAAFVYGHCESRGIPTITVTHDTDAASAASERWHLDDGRLEKLAAG